MSLKRNCMVLGILLISLLAVEVVDSDAEIQFAQQRGKDYYLGDTFKTNWFKASEYCRSRGMFLVSITNGDQRLMISEFLEYKSGYFKTADSISIWTSGNDLGEPGQFRWASTGDRITLAGWATYNEAHNPNNGLTMNHCVEHQMQLNVTANQYYVEHGLDHNDYISSTNTAWCYKENYFLCETLDA